MITTSPKYKELREELEYEKQTFREKYRRLSSIVERVIEPIRGLIKLLDAQKD